MNYKILENGCWEYQGYKGKYGYGLYTKLVNDKRPLAHRFFYENHKGPIPDGLVLDHLCRNRGCVNPDHLEPVTMSVNVHRGLGPAAKNALKTQCKRGHSLSVENVYLTKTKGRQCRPCRRQWEKDHPRKYVDGKRVYATAS